MRFFLGLTALALLAPTSFAEEKTAKDVLAKALEAIGGEKTVKKYPAAVQKSKGTIQIMGMEVPFTSHEMMLEPDKMKQTITIEAGGQELKIVQVMNGDNVSMTIAGADMALDGDAKAELIEGAMLARILNVYPLLEDKGFEVKLLGEKGKVGDKEAYVLTVSHKKLRETKLFIDAKTFLVTKLEKEGTNAEMQKCKQEWFFEDHKKTDGVTMPMKSKITHDGKAFLDVEITEIKLLEKLDKSEFDVGK
jgi:hypothetical protein